MPELNRRRFLQITGATAGFAALSSSIERAAAIPAARRTGSLKDVEHIVVLMQENRSFDQYFGAMKGVRGFGDPRPVTLPGGKNVFHQPKKPGDATEVLPYRADEEDLGMKFLAGLDHSWNGSHKALNGGKYDGWIAAKSEETMAYMNRDDIPFFYALADKFTVCDAYHCSYIGNTEPNRYYMWTGYQGGEKDSIGGQVVSGDKPGNPGISYVERLEEAGISWKYYQDIGNGLNGAGEWGWTEDAYIGCYGCNTLLYNETFRKAKPGEPLYDKARGGTEIKKSGELLDDLRADIRAGKLPQVSYVTAPEAFDEHPNWPTNYGAWYIAQLLDVLTSDPEVWSKTALFITYDENDGYFDHVVPPYAPASPDQGKATMDTAAEIYKGDAENEAGPYGLGPRVPMLVVSPWSTGGYVCSETLDHTSIIRFIEERFGVEEPQITPWRRAVCGDLTSAFDFSLKDTDRPELPDVDAYEPPDNDRHDSWNPARPDVPQALKQEKGARRTRPLPYAPLTDIAPDPATGKVTLTFGGGEKAGAHFHVTSGNRTDGPWVYSTEAAKTLTDTWSTDGTDGSYDLTVHGPNGFLRTFQGPAKQQTPEVTARHVAAGGALELTLTNPTEKRVTLNVTNAYGGKPRKLALRPGTTTTHTLPLAPTRHWYDVRITTDSAPTYLRRLAGHVETGKPGVTDPAIATH
ncbi:phosphocholine-specific phospholipase C [Streptomyces sp. NPDC048172]|uniref:phosphocholine-specific phospholipase C n=1 Tax=Streptomyces sp. NPDC048172 TaxID=3365505 RepID=UPI003722EE76